MLKPLFVCLLLASLQLICSAAPDSSFDNMFKVHGEDHNFAECQIFSKKYEKWWLHAEKYTNSNSRRNVTLGRFLVFSDKVNFLRTRIDWYQPISLLNSKAML
jgi:hypothetical protein